MNNADQIRIDQMARYLYDKRDKLINIAIEMAIKQGRAHHVAEAEFKALIIFMLAVLIQDIVHKQKISMTELAQHSLIQSSGRLRAAFEAYEQIKSAKQKPAQAKSNVNPDEVRKQQAKQQAKQDAQEGRGLYTKVGVNPNDDIDKQLRRVAAELKRQENQAQARGEMLSQNAQAKQVAVNYLRDLGPEGRAEYRELYQRYLQAEGTAEMPGARPEEMPAARLGEKPAARPAENLAESPAISPAASAAPGGVNAAFMELKKTLTNDIVNAIPKRYRSGLPRTPGGFYTLFHGERGKFLKDAMENAENPVECLAIIQHQLHLFNPKEPKSELPTHLSNEIKNRLNTPSKWTVNRKIGYYGLLEALKKKVEEGIQADHPALSPK